MRALVTGSTGFIGRYLTDALRVRSAHVTAVGREEVDLLNREGLARFVAEANPDVVFHLAAQASVRSSFADPIGTYKTNVLGTVTLLEATAAARPDARVVIASSAEVYGVVPKVATGISEGVAPKPISPYGGSKLAQETAALQYARWRGLDVVVARCFNAAGPGQRSAFALSAFAEQLSAVAEGAASPSLRVGDLGVVRDFTDVRDIASAYLALADSGRAGEVYNVASGRAVPLSEALEALIDVSGVRVEVTVDPDRLRKTDIPWLVGDPGRIREATGWGATIDLRISLGDLFQYHRDRARSGEIADVPRVPNECTS